MPPHVHRHDPKAGIARATSLVEQHNSGIMIVI
jgi:hypothetical protein